MFTKFSALPRRAIFALVALLLSSGLLLTPATAHTIQAQAFDLLIGVSGPPRATAGENITYEVRLENLSNKTFTTVVVTNNVPDNTTHVSGGTLKTNTDTGKKFVEFVFSNVAAKKTERVTWVAKIDAGLAADSVISNGELNFGIVDPSPGPVGAYGPHTTLIEDKGTLVAVYKNTKGEAWDINTESYKFQNFTKIPNIIKSEDQLGSSDVFQMFGPQVCEYQLGDLCALTAPAEAWRKKTAEKLIGGHCDGLAATSLRLFNAQPWTFYSTPASFQSGASNTVNLNLTSNVANYIARYFQTQFYVWDSHFAGSPNEIVQRLTQDFNKSPSVGYTLSIFQSKSLNPSGNDWTLGHSIVAYGIETVSATETRILVYDNNFPKGRQFIAVNPQANTWRYKTSATPGDSASDYVGNATSENLRMVPLSARDTPAGQYFPCPFCTSSAVRSANADGTTTISGELDFEFTGEGALLIIDDEGRRLGTPVGSEEIINEIPDAEIFHFMGGLGKEIPPLYDVPFTEVDDTFYDVVIHGTTVSTPTFGTMAITGPGFVIGVEDIELDASEVLTFSISPDGDHISFLASETITAPLIFINHDPLVEGNPSVGFEVKDEVLFAGERLELNLDPELERFEFDDTGNEEEDFTVIMTLLFPDGDTHAYTETVIVPEGVTMAEIDFGAWDGLLEPPTYLDGVLQNPSVNHRLKLVSSTGIYDPTPQANAPAGVYQVEATFANVTEVQFSDVYFTVADLAAGNLLLNADGSPAGKDGKISVPPSALGEDEILHVNESFTVTFDVGLAEVGSSLFTVDANGTPHDWTHEAPDLSGVANEASFVFAVEAEAQAVDNTIFLPLLSR